MKKLFTSVVGLALAISLVGCGKTSQSNGSQENPSQINAVQAETTQEASSKDASGQAKASGQDSPSSDKPEPEGGAGKTLVVYYSATGNTKDAAEYIAEATGGDIFELVPTEVYTGDDLDWRDENSRVTYEHENPEARDVELETVTVPDWESYDTVFIGYPIWWGIAAWPVDGFVKANDFTGKTVVPFCTSASSELGESGKLLEEMAGTGSWLEGERFSSGVSQETVQQWVENLGL